MKQLDHNPDQDQATYEITIQGRLDEDWSDWFGGMAIEVENRSGNVPLTRLTGPVADQAALRGILSRLLDLNLTLISVSCVEINGGQDEDSHC